MKVKIHLSDDGMKAIAKGEKPEYSWHFSIWVVGNEGLFAQPKGPCVGELELTLPAKKEVLPAVVAKLEERINETYREAAKAAAELEQEKQQFLAIEYDEGGAV